MFASFESTKTKSVPQVAIYLYKIKEEQDLIQIEPDQPKQEKKPTPSMEVINCKFEDLIGDDQFSLVEDNNKPIYPYDLSKCTVSSNAPPNVMLQLEVMDYIERCNQKHALLMQQVAETRLRCKKLFYSFM